MNFEKAFLDATDNVKEFDEFNTPIPWKGTDTELYYRSFADPSFIERILSG